MANPIRGATKNLSIRKVQQKKVSMKLNGRAKEKLKKKDMMFLN